MICISSDKLRLSVVIADIIIETFFVTTYLRSLIQLNRTEPKPKAKGVSLFMFYSCDDIQRWIFLRQRELNA